MFDQLQACVHTLLQDGNWKAGAIVRLDNALTRCSAADVAINFHMLRPIISFSSDKVPSGYFLTDCILRLDKLFQEKMLVGGQSKLQLKKLVGAEEVGWGCASALAILPCRESPSRIRAEKHVEAFPEQATARRY
ncbi:unnamed protein product [Durusdinium trenchii]|uniref:Uncharacterized protein n=1 Tax=Durusdinium trenchii TaxID=1381693 RepID=A0ABP0IGG6_9DINO